MAGTVEGVVMCAGPWLPEEEEILVATMKRLHGSASVDEMVVSPAITWEQVAKDVRTRNSAQCRSKWLHFRPVEWEGRKWIDQDDLQLLELLSGVTAQDEDEINWTQLCLGWENARSPYVLRRKWATLRRRVPGSALKSFAGQWRRVNGSGVVTDCCYFREIRLLDRPPGPSSH